MKQLRMDRFVLDDSLSTKLVKLKEQLIADGRLITEDDCSGQLIPDSILRFSSAATGEMPPLNA